jgi:antitoxin (DNA-binding transcriptional repressor) of toxin-antitoxin stability system
MITITTVELRNNLASYIDRLSRGESFNITYRKKSVAKLESIAPKNKLEVGTGNAIIDFVKNRTDTVPSKIKHDTRSLKEIYDEMKKNDLR